jgi:hypothetical protein
MVTTHAFREHLNDTQAASSRGVPLEEHELHAANSNLDLYTRSGGSDKPLLNQKAKEPIANDLIVPPAPYPSGAEAPRSGIDSKVQTKSPTRPIEPGGTAAGADKHQHKDKGVTEFVTDQLWMSYKAAKETLIAPLEAAKDLVLGTKKTSTPPVKTPADFARELKK